MIQEGNPAVRALIRHLPVHARAAQRPVSITQNMTVERLDDSVDAKAQDPVPEHVPKFAGGQVINDVDAESKPGVWHKAEASLEDDSSKLCPNVNGNDQENAQEPSEIPQIHDPLNALEEDPEGRAAHTIASTTQNFCLLEIMGMPLKAEIEKLKQELKHKGFSEEEKDREFELGLFLLGHAGSIRSAADAYDKTRRWRASADVDRIRVAIRAGLEPENFPCAKPVSEAFPHLLCQLETTCKGGGPLGISRVGMMDVKRLAITVTVEHFRVCVPFCCICPFP